MYSQNKKRLTVRRTAEANKRGEELKAEDAELRRSLAVSSLGRERVAGKPAKTPAPARPYKQDSEAYKRRKSPVAAIYAILKKGDPVNGHKVR